MSNPTQPCQAEKDLEEIKWSVNQIKDALLGTEFTQNQGLIYRVQRNENEIQEVKELYQKVERKNYYRNGFSAAVGVIAGFIVKKLIESI